jgi:hypothetical protein
MQIHDLSQPQFDMLTTLWAFDSIAEVEAFKRTLSESQQYQFYTLILLLRLQLIDDQIAKTDDYPIATKLFRKLM